MRLNNLYNIYITNAVFATMLLQNEIAKTATCSLNTLRKRNRDTIKHRINYIIALLNSELCQKNNKIPLSPCIDFDSSHDESESKKHKSTNTTHDTRILLNKQYLDFHDVISSLGGKLSYVKSGATGHTFKGTIEIQNNIYNYAVKVCAYPKKEKYGKTHDIRRPENAELHMLRVLSHFVITQQTPHLVLPIIFFDTDIGPFLFLHKNQIVPTDNKKYQEFVEKYKNGEYDNQVSVLICEWANNGDLLDYLRQKYKTLGLLEWKCIFFQILSTLAVIQSKYPSFRHNDLKANNILIHKIESEKTSFNYFVENIKFKIPNIGFQLKICDYDFACIPNIVENNKVDADWTTNINVNPEQNRYYDVHFFFNTLIRKGFLPDMLEVVPIQVREFIDRILPVKLRCNTKYVHKRGRLLSKVEFVTPLQIIMTDPFFADFKQ